METQVIDPIMGISELLKSAGVEATAKFRQSLCAVVELTDLAAANSTAINFALSTTGTPFEIENRLPIDCLFSAVKHSITVAKVKVDAAGAPIWGSAVWYTIPLPTGHPFDDTAVDNDLNEAEQLAQLSQGLLSYFAENKTIDQLIQTAGLTGGMIPAPKYFHLDGKYETNKAILELPTGIITDELGGIAADAGKTKNYVKLEVDGFLMKGLCNPDAVKAALFQSPADCNCTSGCNNCSGTTGTVGTLPPFGLVG